MEKNTAGFKKWLEQKMAAAGIKSQTELGLRIGISNRATMSNIIHGRRPIPDNYLVEMAKALGVSTRELAHQSGGKALKIVKAVDADDWKKLQIKGTIDDRFAVVFYSESHNELVRVKVKTGNGAFALRYDTANTGTAMLDGFMSVILEKREIDPDAMIGRMNLVWLENNEVLLRRILPGQIPNHYNLEAAFTPPLYDQKLLAFAPVQILVYDPK